MDFINNNTFYELLFQSIDESIIVINSKREIVFLNQRTVELFGFSEDELLAEKIEKLIPQKHQNAHPSHVKDYSKNPEKKRMGTGRVLEAQTKKGNIIYVEISLNHLECEDDKFFVALITDVTKRVSSEKKIIELNAKLEDKVVERTKALEKSQFLYTAVAQNFPNGTINVFDKDLKYIFAEGKDLYRHGITSKKLIGTSYIDRLPKDVQNIINEKLQSVFTGEKVEFELHIAKQYFHISAVPLVNNKNIIDSILVVETNVTSQKLASKKLEESLIKEKEINEMKSNFVSMASHEFRTPLSTIISSVSLIDSYIKKDKLEGTEKHIKRIKNSVKGLTSILNDFLSSDKLESQKVAVSIDSFNYSNFKNEITEELQTLCKEGQVILSSINIANQNIKTDQNIIKNILYNLVSNAIKYSAENQEILINSTIATNYLTIEVVDFGIGIPKAEQKLLFNRFFRAKNTINIKGTGLGLNIVQSYLDLLNGSITFDSIENESTQFIVKIPISYEQNCTNRR